MCLLTLRLPPSPSPLRLLALLGVGCFAFMAESLLHLATRGSAVEDFMQLEPMLSAIAAGFAVCNLCGQRRPFSLLLERAMPGVLCFFFTTTGMSMDLGALRRL